MRRNPHIKRDPDQDLDCEIAFHIEELTRANLARGMSAKEARRQAILEFGGREQVKQQLRELHLSPLLEAAAFNLKSALRFLRRSPSFAAAVVLTLALGIGANSAVFSAIDAVVLRPLPFPDGDQLVAISQRDAKGRDANRFVAPARLEDWNRMASTFQAVSGYYTDDLSETSGPLPERVTEALVAPRFLQVMGISPLLGRDLTPQEERFGGPDAVLVSYRFWQRRFHGDPAALGKKLRVGRFSYSIVGIMPASFTFPNENIDFWAPSPPDASYAQRRDATWFNVVGRMKPGVALAQAQADLANAQLRLGKQFPQTDADLVVQSTPLKETIVGGIRGSLWLLYASVTLLLLIACSNIAALLLARTADREHEISIRSALGASRGAIVSQLLTEVLALALIGSLLGLLVAAAAAHGFHLLAKTLPRAAEIDLNWRIAAYSLACALATTLLCGLFPAIQGTRRELAHSLAQSGRAQASARNPVQWILVGAQVTLAVTLLMGAGLLLRSLQELGRVSPGFDPGRVLAFQISGSWGETMDMASLQRRIDRALDALRAIPGVESAATAGALPGVAAKYEIEYSLDGKTDPSRKILADSRVVSTQYFQTMRIPLLLGDPCQQGKNGDLLVNRSFANAYLGDTQVLGHDLRGLANGSVGKIVGLVGDAREEGLNTQPVPTVYSCFSAPGPFPNYLVRTHGDPMAMAETLRRAIHGLEPARSVYAMMPLQEHLDEASSENRLRTALLTFFAATAVSLACVGLYGTLSYLGRLRRREVGLRLALGAARRQIVARFLAQGLRVALLGCVAGLLLSLATGRLLAKMLYGVTALDAKTYVAVPLMMLVVAALASFVPAWRASRVEPNAVLRQD